MDSILVDDMEHCIFCGSNKVHRHHIFFDSDRPLADRYKLIVPLCLEHHTEGKNSPHKNRIVDVSLKSWAQWAYESQIGTREQFRREFRKSYLQ
ncbi:phosphoenolpyruvate carboxykinase [Anaerostipes sp. AF04-45]|nr:phosphoenolpyruvate carboxykinase [Anaerostipes sp. AF04-45]